MKVDFEVQAGAAPGNKSALEMLQAGIPEIELAQSEKFTPHMLNLDVISVDADRNLLLLRGAIPGPKGAVVVVRKAVKVNE